MIKKLINTKIIIIMKKKRHISPLYVPRLVRGIQKIVWYVGNGVRVVTKKLHVAKFLCYVTCILQFCFFSSLTFASAGKAHLPIGASTVFNQKIPVIIDTDMGVDDWSAILYLLNRKDVDVLAITLPITGQSHCQAGMNNVNKLIDLSSKMANKKIPVACGQAYTHKYVASFPSKWRKEADTLGGINLPLSSRRPLSIPAETVIQEAVEKQLKLGIKPVIITLGPLTTMANLLERDPHFKNKIKYLVSMGGAVSVKGNIYYGDPQYYQNTVAEWNFYADPLAAKKVMESGIPFKLVLLDATDTVPLNRKFMNELKHIKKTRIAEFIHTAIAKRIQSQGDTGYCFWDSFTVALALDEGLGSFKQLPLTIKYGDPKISGQIVVDHHSGHYVQVALNANAKRFQQDFLEVINR